MTLYRGLILPVNAANLRTSRTYRHRRGLGYSHDGAPKQCTMRSIHERPAVPYGALLMLP
jgi:transposase, IS30 family